MEIENEIFRASLISAQLAAVRLFVSSYEKRPRVPYFHATSCESGYYGARSDRRADQFAPRRGGIRGRTNERTNERAQQKKSFLGPFISLTNDSEWTARFRIQLRFAELPVQMRREVARRPPPRVLARVLARTIRTARVTRARVSLSRVVP